MPRHRSRRAAGGDRPPAPGAWGVQLIRVWRLSKRRHAAFDGDGARLYGGRWNHPGVAVVYTAAHLSLAVLETLVHAGADEELPGDLIAVFADIPDAVSIAHVTPDDLPAHWRQTPAPRALADLGTEWARSRGTAVLSVPSAVIPVEANYLLNPGHREFRRIRIGAAEPFALDPRLIAAPRR